MPRAELVRTLVAGLPARSDFVDSPDHPLLLQGPDVLALIDGGLTAYFLIGQQIRRIASRVVLSRFAFPPGTSFVAVLDRQVPLEGEYSELFEEVVHINDRGAGHVPAGRMRQSPGSELADSLRFFHHERYAEAWALTTKRWHRKRKTPGEPSSLYAMTEAGPSARYVDFDNGSIFFSPPDTADWRVLRPSLSSVTDIAARYDYGLTRGMEGLSEVSRLANSSVTHLALHHSRLNVAARSSTFDAMKPFRAAAFAGFETMNWRYSDDT
jgi:hypothetical protein